VDINFLKNASTDKLNKKPRKLSQNLRKISDSKEIKINGIHKNDTKKESISKKSK